MSEIDICDLLPKHVEKVFYASNPNAKITRVRATNTHKNLSKLFYNKLGQTIDEEMKLSDVNTAFADKNQNIVYLFHGLDPINITYIEQNGFNYDKISSENLCGRGFYFAESSAKSKDYCPKRVYCEFHKDYPRKVHQTRTEIRYYCKKYSEDRPCYSVHKDYVRCMLLCVVNLGKAKITKDARNISQITHKYNSIVLERNKGHSRYREFILEDETRILPLYKIFFTEQNSKN